MSKMFRQFFKHKHTGGDSEKVDYNDLKNAPTSSTGPTSHVEAIRNSYRDIPTTDTLVPFSTIIVDADSEMTLAGLFTAKKAGLYSYKFVGTNLMFGTGTGYTVVKLLKNSSVEMENVESFINEEAQYHIFSICTDIQLNAGETLSLKARKTATTFTSRWQGGKTRLSITQLR